MKAALMYAVLYEGSHSSQRVHGQDRRQGWCVEVEGKTVRRARESGQSPCRSVGQEDPCKINTICSIDKAAYKAHSLVMRDTLNTLLSFAMVAAIMFAIRRK
jgi:hypothetical protein